MRGLGVSGCRVLGFRARVIWHDFKGGVVLGSGLRSPTGGRLPSLRVPGQHLAMKQTLIVSWGLGFEV